MAIPIWAWAGFPLIVMMPSAAVLLTTFMVVAKGKREHPGLYHVDKENGLRSIPESAYPSSDFVSSGKDPGGRKNDVFVRQEDDPGIMITPSLDLMGGSGARSAVQQQLEHLAFPQLHAHERREESPEEQRVEKVDDKGRNYIDLQKLVVTASEKSD